MLNLIFPGNLLDGHRHPYHPGHTSAPHRTAPTGLAAKFRKQDGRIHKPLPMRQKPYRNRYHVLKNIST